MTEKAKVYIPSPMDVHVKQCVHETMRVGQDGNVYYEKFVFLPANFNCGGCNSPDDVVFMRTTPLNEVIRSCTYCGVTQPVSSRDTYGREVAYLVSAETHAMNVDEIRAFIVRNKMEKKFLPKSIRTLLKVKNTKRKVNIEDLGLKTE